MPRKIRPLLCLALLLLPLLGARAEESLPQEYTAADAAVLLRRGEDCPFYEEWAASRVHSREDPEAEKFDLVRTMLKYLTGQEYAPDRGTGLRLIPCREVPLPENGMTLGAGAQYNLHGLIRSDAPLTRIEIRVDHLKEDYSTYPIRAFTEIDPGENVTRFSLDEDTCGTTQKTLNERIDLRKSAPGPHRLTIRAEDADGNRATLYEIEFTVTDVKNSFPLLQCHFGDNYSLAARFFGGDESLFMPNYSLKDGGGRGISTATVWREQYITDTGTPLGRCHKKALPNFLQAWEYLENTYVILHTPTRDLKPIQLKKLIGSTCDSYMPRFQSNERYISHHALGTCVDVNYDYYPNMNILENHELIGNEVRNNLVYNGIVTADTGEVCYDFTYTGEYAARVNRIPKTIINYLLYELAFYRAGFSWGYYYLSSCDAMHFTLTDCDYCMHDSELMGLRKVYEYIG